MAASTITAVRYDFNVILKEADQFGLFQKILVLVAFLSTIPGASNLVADVFLSYGEAKRCRLPPIDGKTLQDQNQTATDLYHLYLPPVLPNGEMGQGLLGLSSCRKYDVGACGDDIDCMKELHRNQTLTHDNTTSCIHGYVHSRNIFRETTTTEWDLICEKQALNKLPMSLFCLGMLIGAICGGILADRYGRKKTWFFSTLLGGTCGCLCSFSPNIYVFMIFRFFIGACMSSILLCVSVHSMEFVGEKYRPFVGLQIGIFSGIGYMNLALLARFIRSWRQLQLALGCLFFPFLLIIPIIPESPRFLFQSGKMKKGKQVCNLIAKINKKKLDKTLWERAKIYEEEPQTFSPCKLFTKLPLLHMLLNCIALNFTNSLVFFFLSFNVTEWFGNPFLNQSLSGLVELVACIVAIPAASYFGRRTINVFCLAICGSLLIITEVLKVAFVGQQWVKPAEVGILLVAKLTASPSFNLLFLYVAELFPTSLRSTASGLANTGSRLASVMSPLMLTIPLRLQPAITASVGVLALLVSVLAYFCPETKGMSMLTSVEEAIDFYKDGKVATDVEDFNNNEVEWSPAIQKEKEAGVNEEEEENESQEIILIKNF